MRKAISVVGIIIGICIVVTGCTSVTHRSSPRNASSINALIVASLPLSEKALQNTPIIVKLIDHSKQPVANAQISVSFVMPSMAMPPNSVQLVETARGSGIYEGNGIFTMPGAWRLDFTAKKGGLVTTTSKMVDVQ